MAIPKNDKRKESAPDQDARAIQREMAEWLKLAETVLRPLEPLKST
jgi:hypothetical protein